MPWVELALSAIELATELAKRAKQSGELTEAEEALLDERAKGMFAEFSAAPPPPDGFK